MKRANCPEGYQMTFIANLTIGGRCLPLSYEDAEHETRERQINDENRCPTGYDLTDIDEEPEEEYSNIGKCVKN
jgi:hypothetical protein